jgi:hypothetical protein
MKFLILMVLVLMIGCSTTKQEERITAIEEDQAYNAHMIGQWSETVEKRFKLLGDAVIKHEALLKRINAHGTRVQ